MRKTGRMDPKLEKMWRRLLESAEHARNADDIFLFITFFLF